MPLQRGYVEQPIKLRPAYRPVFAVRKRIALPQRGQSPSSSHFSRGGRAGSLGASLLGTVPGKVLGLGTVGRGSSGAALRPNNLPNAHSPPHRTAMNSRMANPPAPPPRPPRPPPLPPPLPPPRAAALSLIRPTAKSKSARRGNSFRSIVNTKLILAKRHHLRSLLIPQFSGSNVMCLEIR